MGAQENRNKPGEQKQTISPGKEIGQGSKGCC